MVLGAVLIWAAIFVTIVVALFTVPRWFARSLHRHRFWRLRDEIADDVLTGVLPGDHPAVQQLRSRVRRVIDTSSGVTLLSGLVFHRWATQLSTEARAELQRRTDPRALDGLEPTQCELLLAYRERLSVLMATRRVTLTQPWPPSTSRHAHL